MVSDFGAVDSISHREFLEMHRKATAICNMTATVLDFHFCNIFVRTPRSLVVFFLCFHHLLHSCVRIILGPFGLLQVPYSFSTPTMTESKTTIVVSMSKQLVYNLELRFRARSIGCLYLEKLTIQSYLT